MGPVELGRNIPLLGGSIFNEKLGSKFSGNQQSDDLFRVFLIQNDFS